MTDEEMQAELRRLRAEVERLRTQSSSSTGEVASREAQRVAGHVGDQAQQIGSAAREQAARVKDEGQVQARQFLDQARTQLVDQGRGQVDRLTMLLRDLSGDFQALLEGRRDEAGNLPDYAEQLARQLRRGADRIDELGLKGVLDEVQRFARRRPGAFLAGAAVAGFAVSRFGRSAVEAQQQAEMPSQSRRPDGQASTRAVRRSSPEQSEHAPPRRQGTVDESWQERQPASQGQSVSGGAV